MYLLEVIPIARGIAKETLSYFSKTEILPGFVVFVPLRSRVIPSIVLSIKEIKDVKTQLRGSQFALRKVSPKKAVPFLTKEFITTAQKVALHSATTTGAVLYIMLPKPILDSIEAIKKGEAESNTTTAPPRKILGDKLVFQAETDERISRYRAIIRESFARNSSIMIIVPTIADIERVHDELARGIQEYVFCFHSGLTKKEMIKRWKSAQESKHPVLIIGTPSFVSLFREDLGTIILEKERARTYKLSHRPHIDMRVFVELYAEMMGIRLIIADFPLRIETLWRYREHDLQDIMPPKLRLLTSAKTTLIDMREESLQQKTKFKILSDKMKNLVTENVKNSEHCFLFTARRGLAPTTVCRDCGTTVMSEDGTVPMVLQKTEHGNAFVSHRTGEMRSAHERCNVCKSWRLEALGIGIERTLEAVETLIDERMIFIVDKDKTPTHRKVQAVVDRFYSTPGAVLLGTELAIPYLQKPIENSGIVSADSLLSLPEWRITARVFSLILSMREITTKHMLVQTRKAETDIFGLALSGNIGEFYRNEIALRKEFEYPPFSVLIKISIMGTPARVSKEMEEVEKLFEEFEINMYPAAFEVGGGKEVRHALLRVPKDEWPDKEIIQKLRQLPPHFAIDVDPENLL